MSIYHESMATLMLYIGYTVSGAAGAGLAAYLLGCAGTLLWRRMRDVHTFAKAFNALREAQRHAPTLLGDDA